MKKRSLIFPRDVGSMVIGHVLAVVELDDGSHLVTVKDDDGTTRTLRIPKKRMP